MASLLVITPAEGESILAFQRRIVEQKGDIVLLLGQFERVFLVDKEQADIFFEAIKGIHHRLRIAIRSRPLVAQARKKGLRVIDRVPDLKHILQGDPQLQEALRVFLPQIWRQQLRSRLQSMGLLSLPKLRIWALVILSLAVFYFVAFRLLPSAEITIVPREDVVTQTANIFLVQSGATVDIPARVKTVELLPIRIEIERRLTFNDISKEFIGTSAQVAMTVVNKADETYSLRGGTRVANQAGMIFRLQEPVIIDPGQEKTVLAIADDLDLYGEIIGARGNVPADLQWYFPGLEDKDNEVIHGENRVEATGGTTLYRTVLQENDLKLAEAQLKEDLLSQANEQVDEALELKNDQIPGAMLTRLYYDELTEITFSDFEMPTEFIGEKVTSVPVAGKLTYVAYAYDEEYVLELLKKELLGHVEEGRELLPETVTRDRLEAHVIDYTDDLSWIKLTVDLSGTQRYILDPLSPTGARFARRIRETVAGLPLEEAKGIVRNFPEVNEIQVSIWPPWSSSLPAIPLHIRVNVLES